MPSGSRMRSSRPTKTTVDRRPSRGAQGSATVSDTRTWLRRAYCIGSAAMEKPTPPFAFSARTRVGFSDTDAQGIVYYGRYNPYFDLARVEYLRRLGLLRRLGDADFVMRANTVEYLAPAVFDDEIEVFVRVARLGRTSVTYELAAYRDPDDVQMA